MICAGGEVLRGKGGEAGDSGAVVGAVVLLGELGEGLCDGFGGDGGCELWWLGLRRLLHLLFE